MVYLFALIYIIEKLMELMEQLMEIFITYLF